MSKDSTNLCGTARNIEQKLHEVSGELSRICQEIGLLTPGRSGQCDDNPPSLASILRDAEETADHLLVVAQDIRAQIGSAEKAMFGNASGWRIITIVWR